MPTLTEVIEIGLPGGWIEPVPTAPVYGPAAPAAAAALDEAELAQRVLRDVQQNLDVVFEARLREALAPALARAADGLIRELRPELTEVLRDLVQDAVVRALHRSAGG